MLIMWIIYGIAALTIAALYLICRAHERTRQEKVRLLRRRVADMLWFMALQDEGTRPPR